MLKRISATLARLNRAHKRFALQCELRQITTWGGYYSEWRAPRIMAEIAELDALDVAPEPPRRRRTDPVKVTQYGPRPGERSVTIYRVK